MDLTGGLTQADACHGARTKTTIHIEDIVGVKGDVVRGRKTFPHPFPARMPLEVAQAAIMAISKPGDMVLDPMTGSGVVPRAALTLGRQAIGTDVDPLAIMQARALCTSCDPAAVVEAARMVMVEAREVLTGGWTEGLWSTLNDEDRKFVDYWFERDHADELFALALCLDTVSPPSLKPVIGTLLSSLIISKGSGASRAMDLSRSRPHRVASKVPRSPFAQWERKTKDFARFYETVTNVGRADLSVGDARELDLDDDSVDAIVTSPPYVNAIDYMRISKFTLIFLGKELRDLRAIRAGAVGTEVGMASGVLPTAFDALVDDHVTDAKRRPMMRRYLYDLRASLAESARVLKPGGHAIYVMGPSILSRRDYDAAKVLNEVAASVGFRPVANGRRDLAASRRSLPPPRRSQRGETLNTRMSCEVFVALRKDHE